MNMKGYRNYSTPSLHHRRIFTLDRFNINNFLTFNIKCGSIHLMIVSHTKESTYEEHASKPKFTTIFLTTSIWLCSMSLGKHYGFPPVFFHTITFIHIKAEIHMFSLHTIHAMCVCEGEKGRGRDVKRERENSCI